MKIFLIRHAEATDQITEKFISDDYRYLTLSGRKTAIKTAKNLREELQGIEKIFTSPLIRAVQTAEIFADSIKEIPEVEVAQEMRNESSAVSFQKLLRENYSYSSLAFTGHEPKMSYLAKILTGDKEIKFNFGKAGVCKIDYNIISESGKLKWYYNPSKKEFVK